MQSVVLGIFKAFDCAAHAAVRAQLCPGRVDVVKEATLEMISPIAIRIGLTSWLAESPDHMQIFDVALTNKNSGIRQQMGLTAKCRPILADFSTPHIDSSLSANQDLKPML